MGTSSRLMIQGRHVFDPRRRRQKAGNVSTLLPLCKPKRRSAATTRLLPQAEQDRLKSDENGFNRLISVLALAYLGLV